MDFEAKTAVVTGGGQGIGRACALKLASAGCRLVVNDLDPTACRQTVETIRQNGGKAIGFDGDISRQETVNELYDSAKRHFGPAHILVNSAGFLRQVRLVEMDIDDFDRMIAVHLRGTFLTCRQFIPEMVIESHGVVVNVASQLGQIGAAGLCHYSAAKSGIIGFTKSVAREVAKSGVRVNAVAPGPINTALTSNLSVDWIKAKTAELPLGRFGEPDEVADTVMFLVSDAASLYVGQTLGPNSGDVML